jgi:hypothetical protein
MEEKNGSEEEEIKEEDKKEEEEIKEEDKIILP